MCQDAHGLVRLYINVGPITGSGDHFTTAISDDLASGVVALQRTFPTLGEHLHITCVLAGRLALVGSGVVLSRLLVRLLRRVFRLSRRVIRLSGFVIQVWRYDFHVSWHVFHMSR